MANGTTIRDVATKAGVSIGTASRVFNNAPNISPENLKRVRDAAMELGYQFENAVRVTTNRRNNTKTKIIGVVFTELGEAWTNHPLIATYIKGIEKACRERGYHPLIEMAQKDPELPRCVREGLIEGLLIKATNRVPEFVNSLPKNLHVVGISMKDPTIQIPQVMPDVHLAGWTATEYLWRHGHRRIAFICNDSMHRMFIGRYQGYEEFLRSQRAFDPALVILEEKVDSALAQPMQVFPDFNEQLKRLFSGAAESRPTAIVAANDWMAAGIYVAASNLGLRIPEDISVVGMDNGIEGYTLKPQLTSYAVALAETAYIATTTLVDRIESPNRNPYASIQSVPGNIIERGSVRSI